MDSTNTQSASSQNTSIWAVLSIIFAFLFPLLGLIFGIVALVQIKKNPNLKGKGLAIAGIIIGGIFTLIFVLFFVGGFLAYFAYT